MRLHELLAIFRLHGRSTASMRDRHAVGCWIVAICAARRGTALARDVADPWGDSAVIAHSRLVMHCYFQPANADARVLSTNRAGSVCSICVPRRWTCHSAVLLPYPGDVARQHDLDDQPLWYLDAAIFRARALTAPVGTRPDHVAGRPLAVAVSDGLDEHAAVAARDLGRSASAVGENHAAGERMQAFAIVRF